VVKDKISTKLTIIKVKYENNLFFHKINPVFLIYFATTILSFSQERKSGFKSYYCRLSFTL
jgi:hypothetical protein